MRKLWKTLLVLVILAGASAAVYALSRNSKKTDGTKEVEVTTGSIVEKAVAVGHTAQRRRIEVMLAVFVGQLDVERGEFFGQLAVAVLGTLAGHGEDVGRMFSH